MKKRKKYLLWSVLGLFFLGAAVGLYAYKLIFSPNVTEQSYLYIPTGTDYDELLGLLGEHNILKDSVSFTYVAKMKRFGSRILPGRYLVQNDMSNNDLINMLRSGRQTPVRVTFNNIRDIDALAGRIAEQIEADSASLSQFFNTPENYEKQGFTKKTILSAFIPDTYEFFWNTSAEQFFDRMMREYHVFWNEQRIQKAENLSLSPTEVSILASIVQAEQSRHHDEKPTIAGLYINRIRRGMPLESDPTLIFAMGDFSIKRVLNKDKLIDSPYNTYMYPGLPPGPVTMPDKASLNAVLNYEKHDYIFMCAKEDFSGYHYFSKTLRQHNIYARRYHRALNEQKVYR